MCHSVLTILVIACLACTSYAQYQNLTCSADKVGLSYSLDNPTTYYTCKDANTPLVFVCPTGSGYINNGTLAGCVPWQLWDCTWKSGPPSCTKAQVGSQQPDLDPNYYWNCQAVNTPVKASCEVGTGFVPSASGAGCQAWSIWLQSCPY